MISQKAKAYLSGFTETGRSGDGIPSGQMTDTQFRVVARTDGKRVLVSLKIRGEAVAHGVVVD